MTCFQVCTSPTVLKQPNKYSLRSLSLFSPPYHPPFSTLAKEVKKSYAEKEHVPFIAHIPQTPPSTTNFNALLQTPRAPLALSTPTDSFYRSTPHLENAPASTRHARDLQLEDKEDKRQIEDGEAKLEWGMQIVFEEPKGSWSIGKGRNVGLIPLVKVPEEAWVDGRRRLEEGISSTTPRSIPLEVCT
ncbi:hypothetical protein C7212DRAFT_342955 [Tuber magnatum]|uniref:Uncharacterized protein n=1 Tax=Tuber magnatum TaxID=42249 RepID=A0A317SS01_9PEZI|nr:hypothetical protein C7212DRAFT_342955 [Tuber magnatum]